MQPRRIGTEGHHVRQCEQFVIDVYLRSNNGNRVTVSYKSLHGVHSNLSRPFKSTPVRGGRTNFSQPATLFVSRLPS